MSGPDQAGPPRGDHGGDGRLDQPENSARRLAKSVRTRRERRERALSDTRSWLSTFATAGALGWLFVVPTLVGAFLGRAADRHWGTGIFWSATLIFVGACLGAWALWRRVQER